MRSARKLMTTYPSKNNLSIKQRQQLFFYAIDEAENRTQDRTGFGSRVRIESQDTEDDKSKPDQIIPGCLLKCGF